MRMQSEATGLDAFEPGLNPVKVLRDSIGLSQRKAAAEIGCHYQTVYFAEHGMFIPLPPVIMDWAVNVGPYTRSDIVVGYALFQLHRRVGARIKHSIEILTVECLGFPDENPIRNLRKSLNLTQSGFCKEFCIPASWLYDAENVADVFPQRLESIMGKIGFPESLLEEISWRYDR